MTEQSLTELLPEVSRLVEAEMGLHYPPERWADLQRGLRVAGGELGYDNDAAFVSWLLSAPLSRKQIEALASALTVGETFFFRDRQTFTALEHNILPPLIAARRSGDRHLRVWSAGCCTGEEPYSLAILIARLLPDLKDWRVTILATDINPRFLQKAAEGVFGEWSFRDVPAWLKDRYFTKTENGRYAVLPRIKEMVTFTYLNLAGDVYPSLLTGTNAIDMIFCRNVLIYLSGEQTKRVIGNFTRCLVPGGWLSVSATETSPILFTNFAAANFPGVTFYRKDDAPKPSRESAPAPMIAPPPLPPSATDEPPARSAAGPAPGPSQRGRALYEQGRYREATLELEAALGADQGDSGAALLLARICADEGDLPRAQQWCELAITNDKLNPVAYYLRAIILQELGGAEAAIQALKQTLYLKHDLVLAHFALGSLTRRQGRHRESEKHLDNALGLLRAFGAEDVLPESEGITAGRLADMIAHVREVEAPT